MKKKVYFVLLISSAEIEYTHRGGHSFAAIASSIVVNFPWECETVICCLSILDLWYIRFLKTSMEGPVKIDKKMFELNPGVRGKFYGPNSRPRCTTPPPRESRILGALSRLTRFLFRWPLSFPSPSPCIMSVAYQVNCQDHKLSIPLSPSIFRHL